MTTLTWDDDADSVRRSTAARGAISVPGSMVDSSASNREISARASSAAAIAAGSTVTSIDSMTAGMAASYVGRIAERWARDSGSALPWDSHNVSQATAHGATTVIIASFVVSENALT